MTVHLTLDIDSALLPQIAQILDGHAVRQAPAPTEPAPAPAPAVVPTAPTALYTKEDLMKAGAALAQQGLLTELQNLLARYQTRSVSELDPTQYSAFAEDLKALGATL